jgi:hypothetical protein
MMEHKTNSPGASEKLHIWDDPRNVRTLIRGFFVLAGLVFLLDIWFLFVHKHASFEHGELPIETWFGFYSVYGFVSCVLLVVVAKQLRRILMRDENYYGTSATYDASGLKSADLGTVSRQAVDSTDHGAGHA